MTGANKIFFDTAPFIYLVEDHPQYSVPIANFIADQIALFDSHFFTSTLSLAEFYVKPKLENKTHIVEKFKSKLRDLNFVIFDLTPEIAEISSELRSKYKALKIFDSIQLATALKLGCNIFFTNDKDLKPIKDIKVKLVSELLKT